MHIGSIAIAGVTIVTLFTLVIMQPFHVQGSSMSPTMKEGDRLFILKVGKIKAWLLGQDYTPKRGEIIVFHHPVNDEKWVKRVVGLPNERIVIRNNKITIYNEEFPEGFHPQLNLDPPLPEFPLNEPVVDRLIGSREVFVIGDNRLQDGSVDSRREDNTPLESIDGPVFIRIIPLFDFRFF